MLKNRKVKKLTYKTNIIFYLLIVAFVPMIILGGYSYNTYITQTTQRINISATASANQLKSRVDGVLLNVRKNYIENIENDAIKYVLENQINYTDYTYIVDAVEILQGNTYLMEYIIGYTFINFDKNLVISNRGMFSYDQVENKEEIEGLKDFQNENLTRVFWLDQTNKEILAHKNIREDINLAGVSLVLKLPAINKSPYALAIINLDMERLERLIQSEAGDEKITILNEDGTVVYTNDQVMADYCIRHEEEIADKNINQHQVDNGGKYIIASVDSNTINWRYIVGYDVAGIKESANDILKLAAYLMGLIIIVSISAIIFARRIYQPISNLKKYVAVTLEAENNEEEQDEFKYLTTSIGNLVDKKAFLEGLIVNQQSQLAELFQLRLIRGDIKVEQLGIYMEQLGIVKERYYSIISINLRLFTTEKDEIQTNQDAMQDAMRIDLVEKIPEDILKNLMIPPICNHQAISMLITGSTEEGIETKALKVFEQLETYTRTSYEYLISGGMSGIFEEMLEYRKAYNQSIEALKNCQQLNKEDEDELMTTSSFIFYSDIKDDKQSYIYDIVMEKEIKSAVDKGEQVEAFEIVDRFIDELIAHKVAHHECDLYLGRFLVAILTVVADAGISINEILKDYDQNLFIGFNQFYDFEKIRGFYKYKLITPVINGLNAFRESKSSDIVEAVERLIYEKKGDISLAECAEELHYHPTYIWKVMKLEKNMSFTDYISEYKLQEAKRLLLETNMTIADIAKELNYTNTQNFIRFFSKMEGTTPGKYRKEQET